METVSERKVSQVKAPFTRLLDLLAGWGQYAQKDAEDAISDAPEALNAICDLYQEGRNLTLPLSEREQETVLRAFLTEQVLPVLMHEAL